ncbi:MAG: exonuclease SbcCD subunit D [Ruminiclostridium sp.]|nr:exonuclease SbcCD subunit D [Ruminiclostridium sp.]
MKLIHLSDLHLGKRLREYSLIDDQKHILSQIIDIVKDEKPHGVIIAGDVYDKSVPSAEAVEVFDDFLYSLSRTETETFIISGNHDSPERIAFGGRLMNRSGVHLSPVYDGTITKLPLTDEHGTVYVYMLPFVRPADVRRYYPEAEIASYTDAVRTAVENAEFDESARNIIITHQFVTGASRCDSEDKSVGGTDNVDGSVFEKFDYTALGHIHSPQNVGNEKIRYCGTPLKYSFSEAMHKKSVTVAELNEKGSLTVREIQFKPLRDMRIIRGSFEELVSSEKTDDYIKAVLTDEEEIPDAIGRLRFTYPNILELEYDNRRTRGGAEGFSVGTAEESDPLEIFMEFYEKQNNKPMSTEQEEIIKAVIEELKEDKA